MNASSKTIIALALMAVFYYCYVGYKIVKTNEEVFKTVEELRIKNGLR